MPPEHPIDTLPGEWTARSLPAGWCYDIMLDEIVSPGGAVYRFDHNAKAWKLTADFPYDLPS